MVSPVIELFGVRFTLLNVELPPTNVKTVLLPDGVKFIVDVPALKVVPISENKTADAAAVRVTVEALSVVAAVPPFTTPM